MQVMRGLNEALSQLHLKSLRSPRSAIVTTWFTLVDRDLD